jgi:hypothetical protein
MVAACTSWASELTGARRESEMYTLRSLQGGSILFFL